MGEPVPVPGKQEVFVHLAPSRSKKTLLGIPSTSPLCPQCGGFLEIRKFVDSDDRYKDGATLHYARWKLNVNKDLYCPKCDLRWTAEKGPHNFSGMA